MGYKIAFEAIENGCYINFTKNVAFDSYCVVNYIVRSFDLFDKKLKPITKTRNRENTKLNNLFSYFRAFVIKIFSSSLSGISLI
jgi:hypothetical protein